MTFNCSLCDFTSQFESALLMHHQLHHENTKDKFLETCGQAKSKPDTACVRSSDSTISFKYDKLFRGPNRTSSATRLFDKLRARICRSKTMISPQVEEARSTAFSDLVAHETSLDISSECTSKDLKVENSVMSAKDSPPPPITVSPAKELETYSCHLCNFDADRITVLDRHLLNDHKISLENLLTLVMAKTKDGLEESSNIQQQIGNIRQPYYKNVLKMADGEFVIETVVPVVKIMKHATTNTDLKWNDIPDLKDNCQKLTKELETLIKRSPEQCDKENFMEKMQTLNEYMCKFMDTSNTLKRALTEFGSRNSVRDRLAAEQPFFDLTIAERDSPNDWEVTRSEKSERNRMRMDKKLVAESLYF